MSRARRMAASILSALALAIAVAPVRALPAAAASALLDDVRFGPRVGSALPLDLSFYDDSGKLASLRGFFGRRPVVLVLGYYRCRVLCSTVIGELAQAIADSALQAGADMDVVFVSIDPQETPADADAARERWGPRYPYAHLQRWHFLTGRAESQRALATAIGFKYTYDAAERQYAHAAGLVIATPDGRVASALFGVQYQPQILRDRIADAAAGRIAAPPVPLLLRCYHYDPRTGRYSLTVAALLRAAAALTVAGLVLLLWSSSRMRPRSRAHG